MYHSPSLTLNVDANWTWFPSTLSDALYGNDDYEKIITFMSNTSMGLVNTIVKVFSSFLIHITCNS